MVDEPKVEVQVARQDVLFLDTATAIVTVFNPADRPIRLTGVELRFTMESGFRQVPVGLPLTEIVPPRKRSSRIQIPFTVDLAYQEWTNFVQVRLSWQDSGPQSQDTESPIYFIFQLQRPPNRIVFVSHKDPEDEVYATTLRRLLAKVGVEGYLARVDRKPGEDIWESKIPDAIRRSHCVAVLWTAAANKDPTGVIRELRLAKEMGKRVVLFKPAGVAVPSEFPDGVERFDVPELSLDAIRDLAGCLFGIVADMV